MVSTVMPGIGRFVENFDYHLSKTGAQEGADHLLLHFPRPGSLPARSALDPRG